jgi:hypothetical protein
MIGAPISTESYYSNNKNERGELSVMKSDIMSAIRNLEDQMGAQLKRIEKKSAERIEKLTESLNVNNNSATDA